MVTLKQCAILCACSMFFTSASSLAADDKKDGKKTPEGMKITYEEHIKPLFQAKCFTCHKQTKKSSGLDLTNHLALMQGGSSGPAVEPGNPDDSWLYLLVTHEESPHMPPKSPKLPAAELELIKKWIEGGALENSKSKALPKKPKVDISLGSASIGKPEGPPPMPEGLLREPIVLTSRGTSVTAMATSPWAPVVAIAGQKQILLYNTQTLELVGVLAFPEGIAHALKFSRNGSLLMAGGGRGSHSGRVVVWDIKTGKRITEVGEEYDAVLAADISSDQSMIALGSSSKIIRVYSTATGEQMYEIEKHTDWVYSLEFSPDGVLLASSDRNGGMFVWEAHTGRQYLELRGHGGSVCDLSWRADSNLLASCSEDSTVKLWEMQNGRQIKSWGAHGGGARSVEFTHDGRLVSCGRDRVTKAWDQNGKQIRAFEGFGDIAVQCTFNHDGSKVIAGDWTGEIRVWNAADGKRIGNLLTNPPSLKVKVDELNKQIGEAEKKLAAANAAAQPAIKAATAATQAVAAIQQKIQQTGELIKQADVQIAAVPAQQQKVAASLEKSKAQLVTVDEAQKALGVAYETARKLVETNPKDTSLKEAAALSQSARDKMVARSQTIQNGITELMNQAAALTKTIATLETQKKTQADQITAMTKQVPGLQAAAKKAQEAVTKVKPPVDAATAEREAAKAKLVQVQAELKRAEELRAQQQASL